MTCQIHAGRCVKSSMSTRRTRPPLLLPVSTALVAGALALPGVAAAQSCQGAPGASAIQQYCEAIPRGDGGRDTSGGGSGSGGSNGSGSGSGVSAATSKALTQAGRDGAAVQRLAGGTSSSPSKKDGGKRGGNDRERGSGSSSGGGTGVGGGTGTGGGTGGTNAGPKDPSGSPLNAAKNAASTGPAAGQAVAWSIVGLSVLGALAAVGLRRQRGTLPPVGEHADDAGQG